MRYAAEAPLAHVDNDYRHKLHSGNLKKLIKKIIDDQHSAEAATMKHHQDNPTAARAWAAPLAQAKATRGSAT